MRLLGPSYPGKTSRRIGFRVFAVVTGNDTNPEYVRNNTGADGTNPGFGMLFRVNGAPIFSRGANMIPMEELEGRLSAEAHTQLVKSSVDAGMNTLRVWGGGIFLPEAWYDACDEHGILVYHDMQYAQGGHSPKNTTAQALEFRHQVRRLSHHPSIAIYDGCNECHVVLGTPTGIYATFVLTVVVEEDKSRVVWPSCPSGGWTSGVDRLTSLPNGSPLGLGPRIAVGLEMPRSTEPVTVGSDTCDFQVNVDYDQGTFWTHPKANSPQECCDACKADSECVVAVLASGLCWFKKDCKNPVHAPGRTSCWPQGHGPIPPTPPAPPTPPHTIETHVRSGKAPCLFAAAPWLPPLVPHGQGQSVLWLPIVLTALSLWPYEPIPFASSRAAWPATQGPYQHGGGFPAVNGNTAISLFGANIPISISPARTGPQFGNVFASEFGSVVMSSFESMSPTLKPEHWGLHAGEGSR